MGTKHSTHTGILFHYTGNQRRLVFLFFSFILYISHSCSLIHTTEQAGRSVIQNRNILYQKEKYKRHFCMNTIHCYRTNWGEKIVHEGKQQKKDRKKRKIEKCTEIVFDVLKSGRKNNNIVSDRKRGWMRELKSERVVFWSEFSQFSFSWWFSAIWTVDMILFFYLISVKCHSIFYSCFFASFAIV